MVEEIVAHLWVLGIGSGWPEQCSSAVRGGARVRCSPARVFGGAGLRLLGPRASPGHEEDEYRVKRGNAGLQRVAHRGHLACRSGGRRWSDSGEGECRVLGS